ncbi:hypothetical protein HK096_008420 [Nowakowskiella sp. JEL0078]|nr:hypothetical protein HK096_008420 [Nowakowskiella sp. JEL0078]
MKTILQLAIVVLLAQSTFVSADKYSAEFRPKSLHSGRFRNNQIHSDKVDEPVAASGYSFKSLPFKELENSRGSSSSPLRSPLHPPSPLHPVSPVRPLGPARFASKLRPVQPVGPVHPVGPSHPLHPLHPVQPVGPPSHDNLALHRSPLGPSHYKAVKPALADDKDLKSPVHPDGTRLVESSKKNSELKSAVKNSDLKPEELKKSNSKSSNLAAIKSFAATADRSLSTLGKKELSSKNAKLSVDTFQSPHVYRAGLEVYHASSKEASKTSELKAAGNTGDLPDDFKNTLNNVTNTNTLLQTVNGVNWGTGTAAVIFIIVGSLMAFFGYALFKVVLFIGGFFSFAGLGYVVLNIIRSSYPSTAEAFANNGLLIYGIVVITSGLIGGGLTICLWKLGLSLIGGLLGFIIATLIQQSVEGGLIKSDVGRIVFVAIVVIVFAIAILFLERPLLIFGTAFPGAYAVAWGADVFVNTGFKIAALAVLSNNTSSIHLTTGVWIMIGGFLGLGILGTLVQYFWTGKKHHNFGRTGYKNIEKENA